MLPTIGETPPNGGEELKNEKLAKALKSHTTFTRTEWEAFDIKELRPSHYCKAGTKIFSPAALPPESPVSRRVEHIAEQVTESARAHSYYSS